MSELTSNPQAFGAPFGMLPAGADIAEVQSPDGTLTHAPAITVLNRRGEVSSTLGILPALKPYATYLPDPFFRHGLRAVSTLAGIATARVNARLDAPPTSDEKISRKDLLARLMEGRDEAGMPLGREELTAEALTQLIAGSDTTSNTACALLYWCTSTPGIVARLQAELDAAVPAGTDVPSFEMVKDLPFLQNVINETLRIHSTSSLGLPRVVPPGPGVRLAGYHFPTGTVLSVPAYTMHHDIAIWNPWNELAFDPERFNPDRWADGVLTEEQKGAFIPFSVGPRACVGRNVAEMELKLIAATVVGRWEFVNREGGAGGELSGGLETREGFLRKPVRCLVGMRRRVRDGM